VGAVADENSRIVEGNDGDVAGVPLYEWDVRGRGRHFFAALPQRLPWPPFFYSFPHRTALVRLSPFLRAVYAACVAASVVTILPLRAAQDGFGLCAFGSLAFTVTAGSLVTTTFYRGLWFAMPGRKADVW